MSIFISFDFHIKFLVPLVLDVHFFLKIWGLLDNNFIKQMNYAFSFYQCLLLLHRSLDGVTKFLNIMVMLTYFFFSDIWM